MVRYKYCGDVNIEHGGYFYSIQKNACNEEISWVDAVRVVPCSDAGAQDNCFWIEELTIIVHDVTDTSKIKNIISCCGWALDSGGNIIDEHQGTVVAQLSSRAYRSAIVEACIGYGSYDINSTICVSIGKPDGDCQDPVKPDLILRGNASLERYVRKNFLL